MIVFLPRQQGVKGGQYGLQSHPVRLAYTHYAHARLKSVPFRLPAQELF